MTNFEKIKNMSVEEMAEFLQNPRPYCTLGNGDCINAGYAYTCESHTMEWLESGVEK